MSLRARMFLGAALAAATLGGLPPTAIAVAPPLIVPAPDSDGIANATSTPACMPRPGYTQSDQIANPWRNCLLPDHDAVVDWPNPTSPGVADPFFWPSPDAQGRTRSFILSKPGLYAIWLGETRSELGRPLIWYDVGSGIPTPGPSGPYSFPLAGKYAWECLVCGGIERQKLQGSMYVIGPRVIVGTKLVSRDNSGDAVTYGFDASGSFVTDYTAHSIVEYAFDFQDDGVVDQVSPEPTAQATYAPGLHTVSVRITDDIGRVAIYPFAFEVPYVRPGNPEPNPIADSGRDSLNPTGVKFSKANIKLKAAKSIRLKVLRGKGLSVKVTGLTKGDRIKAKLMKGKKTVAAKTTTTQTSTKTVRLKLGKKGKRTLYAGGLARRLVIDVAVEGTDGFTTTPHPRIAVRVK